MGTEASLNGDNCYTSQTSAQQSLAAVPIFTIKETKRGTVMAQYIDKDALVAAIRNRIDSYKGDGIISIGVLKQHCEDFIYSLDTLEVKEVDLEKEIEDYAYQLPHSATGIWGKGISVKAPLARKYGVVHSWDFDDVSIIAHHFFELGMKLKNIQPENVIEIKWKPCTEIPTEHWENNPAISPLYLVKCGSVNGNPILGYAHYSYVSNSWMECFHATEDGVWNVLEWTDKRDI